MVSEFDDPYWVNSARQLAELFSQILNLKDSDLGDNPQAFLASYVPPAGSWDKKTEWLRSMFVRMGDKQFLGIYQTYLEERDKPGFKTWA